MRTGHVKRATGETQISIELNIDGTGQSEINSEIGFFNHMLETFAQHGLFDIKADIRGDLGVDQHHTIEDCGLVLGSAFKEALGDKRGIKRAGFFIYPMDEELAMTALDLSGRPYLKFEATFHDNKVGELHIDLLEDFFQAFASSLLATLHIKLFYGRSDHHSIEAIFKSFARAMKAACEIETRIKNDVPSTKGVL